MKIILLTIVAVLTMLPTYSQPLTPGWAKNFAGTGTSSGRAVAFDAAGNVFTTGEFRGTVDFDPGAGVYNLTSVGEEDIFIAKLDVNGNFLWAASFGDQASDKGLSIDTDNNGNVYLCGMFTSSAFNGAETVPGNVDFDPGPGIAYLSSLGISAFVLKLDEGGNFVWAKSIVGNPYSETANALTIDNNNNLFITGYFFNSIDVDPGPATTILTTLNNTSDIFVTKWDLNGNFTWGKQIGGQESENPYNITTDVQGNVLLTGYFTATADFDPGPGVTNLVSNGSVDIFVCKLNNDGDFIWAKGMGAFPNEDCYSITTDPSGNVILATPFASVFDVDPGPGVYTVSTTGFFDGLICKLSPGGDFLWARTVAGAGNDEIYGVKTDAMGNIYTAGAFAGNVDFDPGPGQAILSSTPNNPDIFYYKLDPNGNYVWVTRLPGAAGIVLAMDMTANHEIATTGFFSQTIDFDPGPGVLNLTASGTDVFVNKLIEVNPLPLTLTSLSGQATPKGNQLKWQTAQEINTAYFEVEWSKNGQQFNKAGSVNAAGNSDRTTSYEYLHRQPIKGINYYRLKMMDKDGKYTNSPVITIRNDGKQPVISLYPNPVTDLLQVNLQATKNETMQLRLTDISGKVVASKSFSLVTGNNQLSWDLHHIPAGNYFIASPDQQFEPIQISRQ